MLTSAFPTGSTLFVVSVVAFLLYLLVARRVDRWLLLPGGLALLGHVVVAVFLIPRVPYSWDIQKFHRVAVSIFDGTVPTLDVSVLSFGTFQALVYSAFAPDPTVLSVVNGLLAVLIVVPVRDLAARLYPSLTSTNALSLVVLFLPLPFVYLTIPMRDALSTLVFFTVLALLVRGYATRTWWPIPLAIPSFGILELLRPELAFLVLVGVPAAVVVHGVQQCTDRPVRIRTLVTVAMPVGVVSLPSLGPHLPVARFQERMLKRTRGSAAYLEGATYDGWRDLVLAGPIRGIYFQFAPFPLHVSQSYHFVSALMLPLLVIIVVAAYRSAKRCERDIVVLTFLATIYVVGIVGYGLTDANFGTTARHRIPFSFLLCVLAAPVFQRWESRARSALGVSSERIRK